MNNRRRIWAHLICIVFGMGMWRTGEAGVIDEFWSGMGIALMLVGIMRLVQMYRFCKDEAYREAVKVASSDERTHFIRNKAWAWAGCVFIMIAGVLVIVFRVRGETLLATATGYAVFLLVGLYWIFYLVLSRKY